MICGRLLSLLLVGSSYAFAIPLLFSGWGAGQFGLVATTPTVNLAGNIGTGSSIQDGVVAVGTGVNLAMSSGTVTGAIDFADAATKNTGGSCASDPGGVCKVNTFSTFTGGTVTGVTLTYNSAVTNAVNEWTNLAAAGAWGLSTGSLAVNLSTAGPFVLCAGSGHSGCTGGMTNNSTVTRTVNGQTQTAYLFDISGTNGAVGGNITIKGDGNTLVVLLYNGTNALNLSKSVTLADGVTSDQVLLNVTSAAGMNNTGAMTLNGTLAVKGTAETLTGATINGRLFLGGAVSSTLGAGFSLNATADTAAPEPGTEILLGSALIGLALLAKRRHS
jgi:hypothetical protein